MDGGTGWLAEVADNVRRYGLLRERATELSITESSGDGTIRVTVSASGLLTDLVLRERWNPVPLPELATEIMDCLQRAQARIPELLRQAVVDTVGPNDPAAQLLLDDARRRFGDQAPDDGPRPGQEVTDREDWAEREVLEDL